MWYVIWIVVSIIAVLLIYILAEKGPLEDDDESKLD